MIAPPTKGDTVMQLRFTVDEDKDILNILHYSYKIADGVDYKKTILNLHPGLKDKDEKAIATYVRTYYEENKQSVIKDMEELEKRWLEIKTAVESELSSVFPGEELEQQIGVYPSIINSNPVFLDDQEFMYGINLSPEQKMLVFIHELMHFMYNNFLKRLELQMNENQRSILLESLNLVLLNKPEFSKFFKPEREMSYPTLRVYKDSISELFSECTDLAEFSHRLLHSPILKQLDQKTGGENMEKKENLPLKGHMNDCPIGNEECEC
jgi:hypothetical protein